MTIYDNNTPFKSELIKRLAETPQEEVKIAEELLANQVEGSLADFFEVLAHIELSEQEAAKYFKEILNHQEQISFVINRDVGFRVAMLDYLSNIHDKLDNPALLELKSLETTTRHALRDGLTHLFNRSFFDKAILREISRSGRHKQCFSLFFFDIDNFKKINDNYGHQVGDKVLSRIGETLIKNLRLEDVACRYGGEEFVVILPETDKESAIKVANRLREKISEIHFTELVSLSVTISGGIASYPEDSLLAEDLIRKADMAAYSAKKAGKNLIAT